MPGNRRLKKRKHFKKSHQMQSIDRNFSNSNTGKSQTNQEFFVKKEYSHAAMHYKKTLNMRF